MVTYFENLIIELHVLYVFNIHVKFNARQILFTIQSIAYFLCIILYYKNSKLKHLINNVV